MVPTVEKSAARDVIRTHVTQLMAHVTVALHGREPRVPLRCVGRTT